jgi:hypothetical protein
VGVAAAAAAFWVASKASTHTQAPADFAFCVPVAVIVNVCLPLRSPLIEYWVACAA